MESNIAKQLAYDLHSNQKYGKDLPYSVHLDMVNITCLRYAAYYFPNKDEFLDVVAACFLHDTLENCNITYNDLRDFSSENIADIVYCVTNELGKSREERYSRTYPKIKSNRFAVFVKLCDRIANTLFSLTTENYWKNMYGYSVFIPFKEALYTPGQYEEMWAELEMLSKIKLKSYCI